MSEQKLNTGDAPLIAKELGVSKDNVLLLASGLRGKRQNEGQQMILKAVEMRKRQNEQLINYCRQLRVSVVVPEPVH